MTVALPKGLIVSCQAREDNPLHGPTFMGAMALAARDGGAKALRANGPADVRSVKAAGLPVIGIHKVFSDQYPVYITPHFEAAAAIVEAGAEVVALDCTLRPRNGNKPEVLIRRIHEELGAEVFADISTFNEGLAAADWGATYVATTLSGYTDYTDSDPTRPDIELLEKLAIRLNVPVIAEGRFNTPDWVKRGFNAGAHAVVVGTMITNPREITKLFVKDGVPA